MFSKRPPIQNINMLEWEEACCPVCLDPPHNSVLLVCSSYLNGCRPFMCGTSPRHSNCCVTFIKSARDKVEAESAVVNLVQEVSSAVSNNFPSVSGDIATLELKCPLCRGYIFEWIVSKAARSLMNLKKRNCCCETCEFIGNFYDLRLHVLDHQQEARPSEADEQRMFCWKRIQQQSVLDDIIGATRAYHGEIELSNEGRCVAELYSCDPSLLTGRVIRAWSEPIRPRFPTQEDTTHMFAQNILEAMRVQESRLQELMVQERRLQEMRAQEIIIISSDDEDE